MLLITPDLYLCDHEAYGRLVSRLGAVAEARAIMARAGGFKALRQRVDNDAEKARLKKEGEARRASADR